MSCYTYVEGDLRDDINHIVENVVMMELAMRRFKDGHLEEAGIITLNRLLGDTKTMLDFVFNDANRELEAQHQKAQRREKEIDELTKEINTLKEWNKHTDIISEYEKNKKQ